MWTVTFLLPVCLFFVSVQISWYFYASLNSLLRMLHEKRKNNIQAVEKHQCRLVKLVGSDIHHPCIITKKNCIHKCSPHELWELFWIKINYTLLKINVIKKNKRKICSILALVHQIRLFIVNMFICKCKDIVNNPPTDNKFRTIDDPSEETEQDQLINFVCNFV